MVQRLRTEQRARWYSDWGNVLIAALVFYTAGYILWLFGDWGPAVDRTAMTEFAFLPVMVAGIILAWRVAGASALPAKSRLAWKIIALGYSAWLVGDALWARSAINAGSTQFPSLADSAYLLAPLFLIVGILLFPTDPESGRMRLRHYLDFAIILLGVTTLISYFIVGPEVVRFTADISLEALVITGYSVTNTLVILVVFSTLIRRPQSGSVSVMLLLGSGLMLYAAVDLWWAYLEIRGVYVADTVMYTFWIIAQLLLVIAPQRHYDVVNRDLERSSPGRLADLLRVSLPYGAAAIFAAVITLAALPELIDRFGLVVVLMTVLLILFVFRQVLTLRENAQLQIEQVKRESEARFQALVENSTDLISVIGRDFSCQFQSPSIAELTGHDTDAFLGKRMMNWVHPGDRERVERILTDVIDGRYDRVRFQWRLTLPDDVVVYLETIASDELNNPVVAGIVLNSRDVSERQELETKLNYQAHHDNLTGLLNRAGFLNALEHTVKSASEEDGTGLLFIDLDRFKPVNDNLGHKIGDELLKIIASRLRYSVRPDDVLGRIGGDEFTVLLPTIHHETAALHVADRVLATVEEPVVINGNEISVSCSIGVALAEGSKVDPADLLRYADSAMYAAKRNGRGRAAVYEPWMDVEMLTRTRPRVATSP
jgi:diguanylate cyclase (GGDEF)-like protein/PAS domain S-box-containing protein